MTLAEMRARAQALRSQALALITAASVTPEQRTQSENLLTEFRQISGDIATVQDLERVSAEERSRAEAEERAARAGRPALPLPGQDQDQGTERELTQAQREERQTKYTSALRHYLITNDSSQLRAMGAATGAGGGYAVPTATQPDIERAILAYGGVAGYVRRLQTTTGEQINWPTSNDTGNAATVIGENVAQTELDIVLGTKAMNVSILKTNIVSLPKTFIRDAVVDMNAFVRDNLAERAARGLSLYLTGASTDANFDNLFTAASAGPTSATGAAITLVDISNLFGSLDPGYANVGTWVMNRHTQIYLSSLRNTYGTPIFPLDQTGLLSKLYGQDVVIDVNAPSVGLNNRAVLFGNLQKYILRTVESLEIMRLEERYAEFNQVAFLGFFRAGSRLIDAGTHPIQALVQAAV